MDGWIIGWFIKCSITVTEFTVSTILNCKFVINYFAGQQTRNLLIGLLFIIANSYICIQKEIHTFSYFSSFL